MPSVCNSDRKPYLGKLSLQTMKGYHQVIEKCHTSLGQYISKHQDAVARQRSNPKGILALPDEVLSTIAEFACRADWYFHSTHYRIYLDSIARIRKICSRFRTIVLNTPCVWAYISSYYRPPTLKNFLRLSKAAPLTLSLFYEREVLQGRRGDPVETLLSLNELLLHRTRWENLSLHLSPTMARGHPDLLLPSIVGPHVLPSLRKLSVEGKGSFEWFLSRFTFPALQDLDFGEEPLLHVPHIINNNLVKFTCTISSTRLPRAHRPADGAAGESNSLNSLICTLSEARSLKDLHLDIYPDHRKFAASDFPIQTWSEACRRTFFSLRKLTIFIRDDETHTSPPSPPGNCHLLLLFMNMPVLEEMELTFEYKSNERVRVGGQLNAEIGFLESIYISNASYPSLGSLDIDYGGHGGHSPPGRNILHDILLRMPRLHTLSVLGPELDPLGLGCPVDDTEYWHGFPPLQYIKLEQQPIDVTWVQNFFRILRTAGTEQHFRELLIEESTLNISKRDVRPLRKNIQITDQYAYDEDEDEDEAEGEGEGEEYEIQPEL